MFFCSSVIHPIQVRKCYVFFPVVLPIQVRKCYVFFPIVLPIQVRKCCFFSCCPPHPGRKIICIVLPIQVRKSYVFFPVVLHIRVRKCYVSFLVVLPIQVRENATPATGAMTPQLCGGSCDLKKSRKRRKRGGKRKKIAVLLSWLPIRSCWIGRKTT